MMNMMRMMQGAASMGQNGMNPMMGMMGMMMMSQMQNQMQQMSQMSQMAQQMGQMGQMGGAAQSFMGAGGQGASMEPPPEMLSPAMAMSSWAAIPDPAAEGASEQDKAIADAVAATQHAQYMQQVQFLQQVNAHALNEQKQLNNAMGGMGTQNPSSRFVDDFRAFKLCRFFTRGECMQGRR